MRRVALLCLWAALFSGTTWAQLTVTPAGAAQGLSLSTFATGFPTGDANPGVAGPIGMAFTSSGGVLVSDVPGDVRLFATDTDGQTASSASSIVPIYGTAGALGIASLGGNFYMGRQGNGFGNSVVQINPNGTFVQTIVTGISARDVIADPFTGHLLVSSVGTTIWDVDPIAMTKTPFLTTLDGDGLALSGDGLILYVAGEDGGHIIGFNTQTKVQVFDSGVIAGVDGIALGAGTFAGEIFANTNGGQVVEVDLLNPNNKTILASGGSRGDFVVVDPTDNTLLLTQSDSILRLHGATFEISSVPEPATVAGGILSSVVCALHLLRRLRKA
jgi:hypothetical protein